MPLVPSNASLSGMARLLRNRQAGDVVVTHKSYTHDFAQDWHEHEAGTIDFVLEGGGVGTYAGREIVSSPGTVEFFREGIRHRFRAFTGGIRSMHVVLPAEMIRELPQLRNTLLEELRHTRAHSLAGQVLRELHEPDDSSALQIESIVHELIDEVTRTASQLSPRAGWIGRARDMLHATVDQAVSLGEIADELGINRAHLARTFKAKLGMSVGAYHRRLRLEHAARMIAQYDEPLARIAQRSGFSDQAHMTRQFSAHFATTPARYRQDLRRL